MNIDIPVWLTPCSWQYFSRGVMLKPLFYLYFRNFQYANIYYNRCGVGHSSDHPFCGYMHLCCMSSRSSSAKACGVSSCSSDKLSRAQNKTAASAQVQCWKTHTKNAVGINIFDMISKLQSDNEIKVSD